MSYSLTYAAGVVSVLMSLSFMFGWDLDEGELTEFVQSLLVVAGFVGVLYGRYRKGDLKWFGGRK